MEWNVEAQWSDEQKHAYRIAREQDTLCAIYIPSSTESSLVIFERPSAQALLGDCQMDTPIPDITVSEIEAKRDASELARDIWQDRGIAPKDHHVFVVDINPDRLRYTIPSQTEGDGPKEVFDQVSKQVTQSGWNVEDQGNIGVYYWSWWARQEDRLCIQVGPIEVGLSTVQMDMYAASQSPSECSSRLKDPSFETQTDSTKNEGPK